MKRLLVVPSFQEWEADQGLIKGVIGSAYDLLFPIVLFSIYNLSI